MNSFGLHRGRGNTQSAKEAPLVRSRGLRAPCQRQRERTERRRERNHQGHRRLGHRRKGSVEAQRRSASAPPTRDASRKRRACESAQTAAAPTGGSQTTLRVAASIACVAATQSVHVYRVRCPLREVISLRACQQECSSHTACAVAVFNQYRECYLKVGGRKYVDEAPKAHGTVSCVKLT